MCKKMCSFGLYKTLGFYVEEGIAKLWISNLVV